jgi:CBS domain-containing protein
MMIGRGSGCLPILDKIGRVVGIITTTDLLRLMSRNATPRPAVA